MITSSSFYDCHGHQVGDQVLIAVARGLESALRACDAVARWGGEESLLVFRTQSGEPATERAAVAAEQLESGDQPLCAPQPSASPHTQDEEDIEACVRRADEALFCWKAGGGFRVKHVPEMLLPFRCRAC